MSSSTAASRASPTTTRSTNAHVHRNALLTAAQFVARHRLDASGELAAAINSFIDPTPRITIEHAIKAGDAQLLQRVMNDHYRDGSTRISDRHYISHIVTKALEHAVRSSNDIALLESLLAFAVRMGAATTDGFLRRSSRKAVDAAVELGKVQAFDWLTQHYKQRYAWSSNSVYIAAENGHLPMLKFLLSQCLDDARLIGQIIHKQVAGSAAQGGQLQVLEWLWQDHHDAVVVPDFFDNALTAAATCSDVVIIEWLIATECTLSAYAISQAFVNAISHGHMDAVKFLYAHNYRLDPRVSVHAMQARVALPDVQWLVAHGFDAAVWSLFAYAAAHGDLDVVQWLCAPENNTTNSEALRTDCCSELNAAALNCHVDIVALLLPTVRDDGTVPSLKSVQQRAAARLKPKPTKQDYSNIIWDKHALESVAARGELDGVQCVAAKLLKSKAARQAQLVMKEAAADGHLDVLVWLFKHFKLNDNTLGPTLMVEAAANGHLHVVEWLHQRFGYSDSHVHVVRKRQQRLGGPTNEAMDAVEAAAKYNHVHVVQWLYEHAGARCGRSAMDRAAADEHFELLLFLHEHGSSGGCTVKSIERTFGGGSMDMDIVCWLHENYPHVLDVDIRAMYPDGIGPFGRQQYYSNFSTSFQTYVANITAQ